MLLLRGLDSRLSKDLPSDLQKLRCKVLINPPLVLLSDLISISLSLLSSDVIFRVSTNLILFPTYRWHFML